MMRHLPLAIFIALLAAGPLVLPEFTVTLLNYIGLYAIVAVGLVLLTGVGGLTSFGQAAFVGLGAYTTAWLTTAYGFSPWVTLFIGLAITGAVAFFLGFITLRMGGHYLPLGTIAWGISLYFLFGNVTSSTTRSTSSTATSTSSAAIPASPAFRRSRCSDGNSSRAASSIT